MREEKTLMHPFVQALQEHFTAHQNPEKAEPMARYMKNHFPFLGIQTPERRQLLKDVIQIHTLPDKKTSKLSYVNFGTYQSVNFKRHLILCKNIKSI